MLVLVPWRIQGGLPHPPALFFEQNEAQRAKKFFGGDQALPSFSQGLETQPPPPPPPPLSEGLDPPLLI